MLIAAAQGSVSGDDFLLTSSLVLVMLTVVGGVNYVSGALFGGVIVGVGLSALNGTSAGLAGGAGTVALLVALDLAGVIGDWSFALLTMVVVLALPGVAARLMPERVLTAAQLAERATPRETPPELLGLDAPLTTDERLELDAGLGLPAGIAAAMELREDPDTVVVGEGSVHVPA